ncbi:HET-domain-containing protein [Lophium mytilinum]|uniref:HET-domain-containing protein n=1 Tax=Lophium mytilinum TaxID=390894 RepID=A0A6A6R2R7_9PEZI|nr:HET-domain-containing protein [Lophium mytilinum]
MTGFHTEYPESSDSRLRGGHEAIRSLRNLTSDPEKLDLLRPLSALCAKCQGVIDEWLQSPTEEYHSFTSLTHHESLRALQASAKDGCGLCSIFLGRHDNPPEHSDEARPTFLQPFTPHTGGIVLISRYSHFMILYLSVSYSPDDVDFANDLQDGAGSYWHEIVVQPVSQQGVDYDSPEPCTNTIDALPLVKRWARECTTLHELCERPLKGTIPTRLIDIGGSVPRICLADEVQGDVEYATLSHCWGSLKVPNLTTTTLESFRQEIPPEALPKTFQDAVFVARSLSYSHLWIDSLCILQDSADDWSRESGLMTQVYGDSGLTIAATSAEDGTIGCFFNREKTWRCQVSSSTGQLFELCPISMLDPQRDRLGRRAWAVQERYLSRRTLHLADNQVYWECDEAPACEIFPQGYPAPISMNIVPKYNLRKGQTSRDKWVGIVERYSESELTRNSDKLVAIGGLAKTIRDHTQDDYVAGLWRKDLENQLRWIAWSVTKTERITPYVAPTWSWASLNDPVLYPPMEAPKKEAMTFSVLNFGKLCIKIYDVQVQYASANPFGGIKHAALRLRCEHLFQGTVERVRPESHGSGIQFANSYAPFLSTWFDCFTQATSIPVYLLPIHKSFSFSWREEEQNPNSTDHWENGLLLEPTKQQEGQYRRIGYYSTSARDSRYETATEKENLVEQNSVVHFAEVSATKDGVKEYFIDLV